MNLPYWVEEYKNQINTSLENFYDNDELGGMVRTSLNPGKRLRPVICLLSHDILNGSNNDDAMSMACFFELLHAASLIQDDVIDEGSIRRGKQTLVKEYGLNNSLLVFDELVSISYHIFEELSKNVPDLMPELLRIAARVQKSTIRGEFMELSNSLVSEEDYMEIISLKSASLFASAAQAGAMLGQGSEKEINALYELGLKLGTAYQIQDDLRDLLGAPEDMLKPNFMDVKNGILTLPLIHALKNSKGDELKFLEKSIENKNLSSSERDRIKSVLRELGSFRYSERKVEALLESAIKKLYSLPENKARERFKELIELVGSMN